MVITKMTWVERSWTMVALASVVLFNNRTLASRPGLRLSLFLGLVLLALVTTWLELTGRIERR